MKDSMSLLRRLDAGESAFFQRQLEYVKSRTYDTKFKELKAFNLIPMSFEAPAGAESITYDKYTMIGIAKIISDYASDLPRADAYGESATAKVYSIANSYGYNIKEIRKAQMARSNLNEKKAIATRRGIDAKINAIALSGDSEYGINGIVNYPGVSNYTVPADGSGSSKLWSTKSADQIARDLSGLVTTVYTLTNGVEHPDTVLLPLSKYRYIATTRMGDGSDRTVLQFFKDNNPEITTVDWIVELTGAGAGGTDRMMVYRRDPMALTLEIPLAFEQLPEQWKGLEAIIPCEAETAGIIVYYPLSMAYGDGI